MSLLAWCFYLLLRYYLINLQILIPVNLRRMAVCDIFNKYSTAHYVLYIFIYEVFFSIFPLSNTLLTMCPVSCVQWTVLYLNLSGSVYEIQGLQFIRILSPHPQIWCRYSHLKNKGYRQCSYLTNNCHGYFLRSFSKRRSSLLITNDTLHHGFLHPLRIYTYIVVDINIWTAPDLDSWSTDVWPVPAK